MSDEDGPERLSHEWHALSAEQGAAETEELIRLTDDDDESEMRDHYQGELAEYRDLAQKLRQAEKDAAEMERLRELLRFAEWCGREGYDAELEVCPWCRGLNPSTEASTLEVYEPVGPAGHKPDCEYLALERGENRDEVPDAK